MTRIGNVVTTGALIGYMLATAAFGFSTGSNMAGIVGLIFGVPIGIVAGVAVSSIWSKESRSGALVFWWIVAAVMVIYLFVVAVVMFLNWKLGAGGIS